MNPRAQKTQPGIKICLWASSLLLLCGGGAFGNVLYTYTGNPFTTAYAPLTTSDFIIFSFTVANPIGASVTNFQPTLLTWSFSDGNPADTITNTTPGFNLTIEPLVVSTGASGDIIAWTEFLRNSGGTGVYQTRSTPAQTIDIVFQFQLPAHISGNSFNQNDAGVWTSQNVSGVPEPASFLMLSTAALYLGGAKFYWRRYRSPNSRNERQQPS